MGPFGRFRELEDQAEKLALEKLSSALFPSLRKRFVLLQKKVEGWLDGRGNGRGEVKRIVYFGYFVPDYQYFELTVRVNQTDGSNRRFGRTTLKFL